jgi:hypothetical protein|tara:strand:+ start:99 stop:515 length:417 start_codon:yes stop_codon:yes gene_type:complete
MDFRLPQWISKIGRESLLEPTLEDEQLPSSEEGSAEPKRKGSKTFARIKRELSDDELGQTGFQKMQMDNVERLEEECFELRGYIERYHEADKQVGVLNEKLKSKKSHEVIYSSMLAAGSQITVIREPLALTSHLTISC